MCRPKSLLPGRGPRRSGVSDNPEPQTPEGEPKRATREQREGHRWSFENPSMELREPSENSPITLRLPTENPQPKDENPSENPNKI